MADKLLDARRLTCPLPILKTTKAMKEVPIGGTLEVLATDPQSVADFEAFAAKGRHEIVERGQDDGVYRFVLRRGR